MLAGAFSTVASTQLAIAPTAPLQNPDMIANNIKAECGLPEKQIDQLEFFLKAAKIDYDVAATGEFLDL